MWRKTNIRFKVDAVCIVMGTNGDRMSELCCEFRYLTWKRDSPLILLLITSPRRLLPSNDTQPQGFDIVIMSDLLHFDTSHDLLLLSLKSLLSKAATSRAYVAAGNYTRPNVCDNFLREGERLGILWEEGENDPTEAEWHGTLEVTGLDKTQLAARKSVCRWWLGRWAEFQK
jgi:hypothetical protein